MMRAWSFCRSRKTKNAADGGILITGIELPVAVTETRWGQYEDEKTDGNGHDDRRAVVFALYRLGWKEAVAIYLIRVVLVSMLFGSIASLFYSLAGAVLSLTGMGLLKKTGKFTEIMISVTGGILHNIGQIGMACLILETAALRYYLPFLLISGIIAGIVVGILSAVLVQRIKLP